MSLFWKRRQQERENVEVEERYDTDKAIAAISARLRFLEALTADLVAELPPTKRDRLLQHLREVVSELKILPPPIPVPPSKEQEFQKELSRAMAVLIEKNNELKTTNRGPIKR